MKFLPAALSFLFLLLSFPDNSFSQPTLKADSMMVQESLMVTIEEHFGPGVESIADALARIERKYMAYDKQGRTFAILDAFGNKMPDGRMHISMHISAEKAGYAELVISTTGKVIWSCSIHPRRDGTRTAGTKQLNIYIERENEKDKYYTVDGSGNPATIFNCRLDETKESVNDYWKNNTVKEFIFIYSACGCPVHAKFLRQGNRSVFQSGDAVIFPDDSEVLVMLRKLMAL
jgi:hypothetical protein